MSLFTTGLAPIILASSSVASDSSVTNKALTKRLQSVNIASKWKDHLKKKQQKTWKKNLDWRNSYENRQKKKQKPNWSNCKYGSIADILKELFSESYADKKQHKDLNVDKIEELYTAKDQNLKSGAIADILKELFSEI